MRATCVLDMNGKKLSDVIDSWNQHQVAVKSAKNQHR